MKILLVMLLASALGPLCDAAETAVATRIEGRQWGGLTWIATLMILLSGWRVRRPSYSSLMSSLLLFIPYFLIYFPFLDPLYRIILGMGNATPPPSIQQQLIPLILELLTFLANLLQNGLGSQPPQDILQAIINLINQILQLLGFTGAPVTLPPAVTTAATAATTMATAATTSATAATTMATTMATTVTPTTTQSQSLNLLQQLIQAVIDLLKNLLPQIGVTDPTLAAVLNQLQIALQALVASPSLNTLTPDQTTSLVTILSNLMMALSTLLTNPTSKSSLLDLLQQLLESILGMPNSGSSLDSITTLIQSLINTLG